MKKKARYTMTVLAVTTVWLLIGLGRAGSASERVDRVVVAQGNTSLAELRTFRDFDVFSAGASFQGLRLTAAHRVLSQSSGSGRVEANYVTFLYGSCRIRGGHGCSPPLEIQVWTACERNPSVYDWTRTQAAAIEHRKVRGVPAAYYGAFGRPRLELSTGRVTIVIFGSSRQQVFRAAGSLQRVNRGDTRIRGRRLPSPALGATSGKLACD